jgi:hypothetical protein
MAEKAIVGFYEEPLTRLVMALAVAPEQWHGEFEAVERIPFARWEFFSQIAILYAAGIGALNFLGGEDQDKFREDLPIIFATVFPNAKKANAGYIKLHERFAKMERKRRPDEPAHPELIAVLLGHWVLGEALHWKRVSPENAPAVAHVGAAIVEEFLNWFDQDYEPGFELVDDSDPGAGP